MTGMRCARHHRFKASSGCFGGCFPPFDWDPANGRNRRIHVIAAHSGEGPFIVRFADLCQPTAFDLGYA
jgi:hypothetical protein